METTITVLTGKGDRSTSEDIYRASSEVMQIADFVGGEILSEKHLYDGVRLTLAR
jgi:hypothetical protein